jgi:hypothetical protein
MFSHPYLLPLPFLLQLTLYTSLWIGKRQSRVVATSAFHGKPRYDMVQIRGSEDGTVVWYAKVHAIVGCTIANRKMILCLVQWYDDEGRNNPLGVPRVRALDSFEV